MISETVYKTFMFYQSLCGKCQKGYCYPGGDCKTKPSDNRPLKCAICKHPGKKKNEL